MSIRWQRIANALHTDLESSKVLLNMDDGTYYDLQGVGGAIWNLIEEPKTAAEIVVAILAEYEAPEAEVKKDVDEFLADLEANGLAKRV